jgi:hypothetical protein
VEKHLLNCELCRAALLRLRAGHRMAQELRQIRPDRERPQFETLMAGAGGTGFGHRARSLVFETWLDRLATPRVVEVLAVLVMVQAALLLSSNRGFLLGARNGVAFKPSDLKLTEFRQLSIPQLKSNTQPHISTDGYVRDLRTDDEEGTVQFKLVERRGGSAPFVVCEIISAQIDAPREGSHVRVYGVARYDAQTGRKWNEINPVLNIATLKQ